VCDQKLEHRARPWKHASLGGKLQSSTTRRRGILRIAISTAPHLSGSGGSACPRAWLYVHHPGNKKWKYECRASKFLAWNAVRSLLREGRGVRKSHSNTAGTAIHSATTIHFGNTNMSGTSRWMSYNWCFAEMCVESWTWPAVCSVSWVCE